MPRSTIYALALLLGVATAVPEALAQSTTTTEQQPQARRSRARTTTATTTRPARQPSAAQLASRQRMRDCGAEWRSIRGTPRAENRTWRQFSTECLRRGREGTTTTTRRRQGSF